MDYEKHYNSLIAKRKEHKLSKRHCYCERHHIVPKSIGGTNQSINLINLTAKEHFVAHRLLEKFTCQKYGENSKQHRAMAQALWFMMHDKKYPQMKITARSYEEIRAVYSKSVSGVFNRQYGKCGENSKLYGRKQSTKSNELNRQSHVGRKHMHHPTSDEAICVRNDEVDAYLAKGYVLGMSIHERNAISCRNKKQKHMFNPETNQQVYAQPSDIQKYLSQGFQFGRSPIVSHAHNEKLKGRFAFYDKDTHKKFYVEKDKFQEMIDKGHIPSNSSRRKMNEQR